MWIVSGGVCIGIVHSLDRSVLGGIESRNMLTESVSRERIEEGIPRAK